MNRSMHNPSSFTPQTDELKSVRKDVLHLIQFLTCQRLLAPAGASVFRDIPVAHTSGPEWTRTTDPCVISTVL